MTVPAPSRIRRGEGRWLALFLAPYLIGLAVFVVGPVLFSLGMSLTTWNLFGALSWAGFANFRQAWTDPVFWRALTNTGYYAATVVPGELVLALGLAMLLNRRFRMQGLLRSVLFSPFVMSLAAVALIWTWYLSPNFGLLSYLLRFLGIEAPGWLQTPRLAMPAISVTSIWRNVGYYTVILLAGLQAIPSELVEAARVDGAGPWRQFTAVVLPAISPTLFFVLVMATLWAGQVFELPYLMTQGGPENATLTVVQYIYMNAFQYGSMGLAAAMSAVLLAILLALTWVYFKSQKWWVFYG